jgi:hypothetical protein
MEFFAMIYAGIGILLTFVVDVVAQRYYGNPLTNKEVIFLVILWPICLIIAIFTSK